MSCKGRTATLVEIEIFFVIEAIFTAICKGDGIIKRFIKWCSGIEIDLKPSLSANSA